MEIWRGGKTSPYIRAESTEVQIDCGSPTKRDNRQGLKLRFQIPSAGGGDTKLILWFEPHEFQAIAAEMMAADVDAAQRAFLEVMLAKAKRKK